MIYLDNGATSFYKPPGVGRAMLRALQTCASPGRGGYAAARQAAETVYECRRTAGELFGCQPEQVVLTGNCTHSLNLAIRSLVQPGDRVVVSGFEHNAVMRPLYALGAEISIAGRRLFDPEDTLEAFRRHLPGAAAAVFTHVSNVFGYILPVQEMAQLCREYSVPFILDAAQSAGSLRVRLDELGARFICMPGHKGLHGPQGTGLLLCAGDTVPLIYGGTGSESLRHDMPEEPPERLEAGTLNVPGAAGLTEGMGYVRSLGLNRIAQRERMLAKRCAEGLEQLGMQVFHGEQQLGTVSFRCALDCEAAAEYLASVGIAVRAGLHCAPLAHESAGTVDTGTVRISFGPENDERQVDALLRFARGLKPFYG